MVHVFAHMEESVPVGEAQHNVADLFGFRHE